MAKGSYMGKAKSRRGSYRSAFTGRFVTSKRAKRLVTAEGIARLRARGASEEFLDAASGNSQTKASRAAE